MSQSSHADDNNATRAIAIPWGFFKNSRGNNILDGQKNQMNFDHTKK